MKQIVQVVATGLLGIALLVVVVMSRTGAAPTQGPLLVQSQAAAAEAPATRLATQSASTASILGPAKEPAQLPGPCLNHSTSIDRVAPTIETLSRTASDIVVGRVVEVGPSQWNTPTGDPPEGEDDWDAFNVFRLVRFSVDDSIKGTAPADLVVWVSGGTIGCHEFTMELVPGSLKAGQRYALFLNATAPQAKLAISALMVDQMWPVDSAGRVATPEDGTVTVPTLRAKVNG